MIKERLMQEAIKAVLDASPDWPLPATVIVARKGFSFEELQTMVAKTKFCVVVEEPDEQEGVYGACAFNERSTWTLSVFTTEIFNKTGMDNLTAAILVREILAETNPGNYWAETLTRCRIKLIGVKDGIVARDVIFTAAYES